MNEITLMNYKKIHDRMIEQLLCTSPITRITNRNPNDWRLSGGTVIYTENHHILPRSVGGNDDPSNIIEVLPEEHLLLHQLRYKIFNTMQDLKAVRFMSDNIHTLSRGKNNIKRYAWVRQKYSETCFGSNHPMFGKNHSDETKKKLSEFRKGKLYAKDAITDEYVGLIDNTHQNIQNGKWCHISKGILCPKKKRNQQKENNSRWSGYTDQEILEHAAILYKQLGGWNRNKWFEYCDKRTPPLPKHYTQQCRFGEFKGTATSKFQQALAQYMNIQNLEKIGKC